MAAPRDDATPFIHRYRDGSIWAKGQTAGGVPTGYWEYFRKDGSKSGSGWFEDGRKTGDWTTYDPDGRVLKVTRMESSPPAASKAKTPSRMKAAPKTKTAANAKAPSRSGTAPRAKAAAKARADAGVIDRYLAGVPDDQRRALEHLRRSIRAAAPKSEECISYGMPAFRLDGKALVYFGAAKGHCSFFPGSSTVVAAHERDLAGRSTSKGTIRFSPEEPLADDLVRKIVRYRIAENASARKAKNAPRR